MESYDRMQIDISNLIDKDLTNFKKSPVDRVTISYIETRLETLELHWKNFFETHREILRNVSKSDLTASDYFNCEIYNKVQETYTDYKVLLKERLFKLNNTQLKKAVSVNSVRDDTTTPHTNVRLPTISIPKFCGKYVEWTTFKDLFTCLIDRNQSLDEVQKLHYLKSYLTGEAEQLVRHVPITAANYNVCWTLLKNRFVNKKYISNHILHRLINQRALLTESSAALKEILDTTSECLNALQNLGVDTSSWDIIVIYIISQKLDAESRKQWEAKSNETPDELPTLDLFKEFLEHKFRSLEFLDTKLKFIKPVRVNHISNLNTVENSVVCLFCKANHKLINCNLFSKESTHARRDFAQVNRLCYNCLGNNHSVFFCKQTARCKICKKKHHSLLHPQDNLVEPTMGEGLDGKGIKVNMTTADPQQEQGETDINTVTACASTTQSRVLLATALIKVKSRIGGDMTMRCLLDQGSQASFITEAAVQSLGLQKYPANILVSGVGSDTNSAINSRFFVILKLCSIYDPTFSFEVKVYVMNKLTAFLPTEKVLLPWWPELAKLKLADPKFDVPNKIDVLFGAGLFCQILEDGVLKGPPGCPLAQKTKLGWILSGQVYSGTNKTETVVTLHTQVDDNLLLRKFWEIESEPLESIHRKILTEEEQRCEEMFAQTTRRDKTGRYIVKLPFREKEPGCQYGNFQKVAAKRLHYLDTKLAKNEMLRERYTAVMNEYVELNHMEVVPEEEKNNQLAVYLPHHAVVKEDRETTKVRVVFDASCPGTNGVSLNHDLMIGPRLQPDLRHLVMRWRSHPICIIADIVKMYRQVKVAKSDIDFQRILWHDKDGNLQHFRMLRVTFGVSAAPYLAVKALQQLAIDESPSFKSVSDIVLKDFYMDDLMTGSETVAEAINIYKDVNSLMEKGGFELQKWRSNCSELLKKLNKAEEKEENKVEITMDKETKQVVKVLGLSWNSCTDKFVYSVQIPPVKTPVTKRQVVSDISRLFDPLGWIAPVVVKAKILIQKIWITGIDWDQELPNKILQEWLSFRKELSSVVGFEIPRWMNTNRNDKLTEIHGFSDASNEAYAAVVYIRIFKDNGTIRVSMVSAKTRVSPIKQVSIPRLELCGAVLLTKLLCEISDVLSIPKERVYAWTDSTVVLAWLSSHPSRWKPFVGNRVAEVINHYDRSHWSYVKSKENPADYASRGVKPSELKELTLWREGPAWLHSCNDSIVNNNSDRAVWDTTLEIRGKVCACATAKEIHDPYIERFSTLRRLVRVFAWCRRFYLRRPSDDKPSWLTATELHESLICCIKRCQDIYLNEDLTNKKSKFMSLSPYLDNNGLWRVGGRLQAANIDEEMKHPILIPRKSHIAQLIVADAHEKTLHGGPRLMVNYIRSKYWITELKSLARSYVHRCITYLRHSARPSQPIMGQLPAARVTTNRPFRFSGVDYAGPIAIRMTKGRGNRVTKGYICLFVCMATKAIHLEVVSDLTSETFLAAFKRFVARRGQCTELWSDNGTTFVGANRELRSLLTAERSSVALEIADWLSSNGTIWHRIPPYSPNFGGLWEAGVKSVKHHLKRIVGNATLTFEELSTVLSQIEACLNSRPISVVSDAVNDPAPLTPGHFLVGEPLILPPDRNFEYSNVNCLRRWQYTQKMVQDFWKRWSSEYLTQFLYRYKWRSQSPEPKLGDVILVKEDFLPPARWLYGVITNKHPGPDNVTRVVSLRSGNGVVIKRPISKLIVLPIAN